MGTTRQSTDTIELKIQQLEKIIDTLESKDQSLEGSMALYKEGTTLIKACQEMIDKVATEIKIIDGQDEE